MTLGAFSRGSAIFLVIGFIVCMKNNLKFCVNRLQVFEKVINFVTEKRGSRGFVMNGNIIINLINNIKW